MFVNRRGACPAGNNINTTMNNTQVVRRKASKNPPSNPAGLPLSGTHVDNRPIEIAASTYIQRRERIAHPAGRTDNAGRCVST